MRRLLPALLAIASFDAAAQGVGGLGTLFQTPQERAAIDRARSGDNGTAPSGFGALRPNPVITGYVKRSDGKHTVFIDNQPFDVKGAKAEAQLQPRNVQAYTPPAPIAQPAAPPASEDADSPKPAGITKGSGALSAPVSPKTTTAR